MRRTSRGERLAPRLQGSPCARMRPAFGTSGATVSLLVVAIVCGFQSTARADKLRRAGKAIRGEDDKKVQPAKSAKRSSAARSTSPRRSRGSSGRRIHVESDVDEDELDWLVFAYPWTLPYGLLEPRGSELTWYAPYPYADGYRGYLHGPGPPRGLLGANVPTFSGSVAAHDPSNDHTIAPGATAADATGRAVALQGSAETSYLWGELARFGAALRLLTPLRLEVDASWSLTGERESSASTVWVGWGTNHVTWRFAQSETVQFRTGIGTRHWIDGIGHELGLDLFYGFEAMLGRPLILGFEAHLGSLGSAIAWQVRGGLGIMLTALELYVGYDHTQVSDVQLGGPMLGARIWL